MLSQGPERGAQLFEKRSGSSHAGEVTALVDLVEIDGDVGVSPLDPAARGARVRRSEPSLAERVILDHRVTLGSRWLRDRLGYRCLTALSMMVKIPPPSGASR